METPFSWSQLLARMCLIGLNIFPKIAYLFSRDWQTYFPSAREIIHIFLNDILGCTEIDILAYLGPILRYD